MSGDLRLFTVRVSGETASGVRFTESKRVAAVDSMGARRGALALFPGCSITSVEIVSVAR